MIPLNIPACATLHGIELADGRFGANLWLRPASAVKNAGSPVITITVRGGDTRAAAPAAINGLKTGLAVCLRYSDFEAALDAFADFAESRTRAPGASR